jgi:hypothetical protein
VKRERLKMQVTRRLVKRLKEGMRITDYGLGGKIKELKAEGNEAGRAECWEAMKQGSFNR